MAPTAGGHGVGLSYAAKKLGEVAHILMPRNADKDRITDIQQNGANVHLFESMGEADLEARRLKEEKGYIRVSAYNDVEMIEGGGTIALELMHWKRIDSLALNLTAIHNHKSMAPTVSISIIHPVAITVRSGRMWIIEPGRNSGWRTSLEVSITIKESLQDSHRNFSLSHLILHVV